MRWCLTLLCLGLASLAFAGETGPWRSFDVKADREPDLVAALEAKGVTVVAWSNAVVEISDFQPLTLVPVKTLTTQLTAQDPRWDPWLAGLPPVFRPKAGVSRLWVAPTDQSRARDALAGEVLGEGAGLSLPVPTAAPATSASAVTPRQVTGWTIVLGSFLYLVVWLVTALLDGDLARRWRGLVVPVLLVLGGFVLTLGPLRFPSVGAAPKAPASWTRHLWFQQSWPYGATWKDWKAGQPWTYLRYERKDGKVVPMETTLEVPDAAWAAAAFAALDAHHAARIFGSENP
jgi:hypothetical protein